MALRVKYDYFISNTYRCISSQLSKMIMLILADR